MLLVNLVYNFALVENSVLLYKLKSKIISMITIVGSVFNILLSNYLVVNYNVNGVILAMLLAFSLTFFLESYFSRRYIKYKYNLKEIFLGLSVIMVYLILSMLGWDAIYYFPMLIYKFVGIKILSVLLYFSVKKAKLKLNNNL